MPTIRTTTATEALPLLAQAVMEEGDEVGSRGGRVMELLFPHIVLTEPWKREVLTPGRNASLPAQIAETMWVLSGRNDVEWLGHYLPRAKDFSDDGKVWRGGYGPRLRDFGGTDQLAHVVDLLRADPLSRRAVISLYDPLVDVEPGKDIPCNNWLHFQSRLGYLHMHVAIRSNDLIWGWSGINAFEWSALQEVVAGMLGVMVGELHFSVSSLHVYDRHWGKAAKLAKRTPPFVVQTSPRFDPRFAATVPELDSLVGLWFELEEGIRSGSYNLADVDSFPEPMLRSWLQIIETWWGDALIIPDELARTALGEAFRLSPRPVEPDLEIAAKTPFWWEDEQGRTADPLFRWGRNAVTPDSFVEYVANLHAEKHAVYGDSWKRRGEQIGILANIARKVDRLGETGAGDTSADTAVDLLVYLCKYRLWLAVELGETIPRGFEGTPIDDGPASVRLMLEGIPSPTGTMHFVEMVDYEKRLFEQLSLAVMEEKTRYGLVENMIGVANRLARLLWSRERHEQWKAGNATRSWSPDA